MSFAKSVRKGVTFYDPLKADDGYTLICPQGDFDVLLIDMEGHVVHRWRMPHLPGSHGMLLPNGNLLFAGRTESNPAKLGLPQECSGLGGVLLEVDWEGNLVWKAEVPYQNHDFYPMENGHVMFNSFHPSGILPDDLAVKVKGGLPGTEFNGKILGDSLFEIDRDGNIVWEWLAYKHLDPEIDTMCLLERRTVWPYINSVWVCRDGNILLSTRHINQATKIDYPTGAVLGRYGKNEVAHPHDCRELDNGNLLVFDNGAHRHNYEPSYSRSVEIDPNKNEITWEYKANPPSDFYTAICGGNERLPNGNTLICETWKGRIFEVTPDGGLAWEYVSPFMGWRSMGIYSNWMWRAHRYPRDYPGLKGKDVDPLKFPWENRLYGPEAFKKAFSP